MPASPLACGQLAELMTYVPPVKVSWRLVSCFLCVWRAAGRASVLQWHLSFIWMSNFWLIPNECLSSYSDVHPRWKHIVPVHGGGGESARSAGRTAQLLDNAATYNTYTVHQWKSKHSLSIQSYRRHAVPLYVIFKQHLCLVLYCSNIFYYQLC